MFQKAQPLKVKEKGNGYVSTTTEEATHVLVSATIDEATHILFYTEGPFYTRILPVKDCGQGGPIWQWNKDIYSPTLFPSILTTDGIHICHSFVRDGKIEYLADSNHEFSGQTLDLLDVYDWEN